MQIQSNGIALEVEDHGPRDGEPLLLVMGLGMQLVAWHMGLVSLLVARGYRVIRFDNRDIGLSQSFDDAGAPNVVRDAIRYTLGLRVTSLYSLADMAEDAVGILDALDIARAHVCGASMGGMIAQHIGARHPLRVLGLTLLMTTSGARGLPGPSLRVRNALIAKPVNPRDTASVVAHYKRLYRLIGSPGHPLPDAQMTAQIELSVKRSYRPQGSGRQIVAIAADGDRSPILPMIAAPTQIIHGAADPLVPVAAAHDLARKIDGALLDIVAGMGHDLPEPLWPRFVTGIDAAAARARVTR